MTRDKTGATGSEGRSRTTRVGRATLELAYPPHRDSAARMRRALRAYLAEQELDPRLICDVVLATDEAFVNAVGHAEAADGLIRVSARVSEREATVEIRDAGDGFVYRRSDPLSVPDVRRASGRGMFLMESLMDEISVTSGCGGTTVHMVLHLA